MNLFKRHIGRRAAGVGVGVALLMLGLEAPAFAAAPTVTGASPTSGPPGCVVVLTGTNFNNPNVTDVDFGATAATFTIQSGTELWTTVPAVAAGATTITVDNGSPPAAVFAFTVTDDAVSPGGCAPTVTTYTPTCGSAGTSVVIAGTNLLAADDGTGGDVLFAPYSSTATHSNAATETPTSLTVFVPTGAADGPIRVETFNSTIGSGAALGATIFEVPPPDCAAAVPFARKITLKLKDKLVAKGKVTASDETAPAECTALVPVKIQRKKKGGGWKTVGKTTTLDTGAYSKKIKNKKGKYRSRAVKITLESGDVCARATSPVRKH